MIIIRCSKCAKKKIKHGLKLTLLSDGKQLFECTNCGDSVVVK